MSSSGATICDGSMSMTTPSGPISLARILAASSGEIAGPSPARCRSAIISADAEATSKPLARKPMANAVGAKPPNGAGIGRRQGQAVRPRNARRTRRVGPSAPLAPNFAESIVTWPCGICATILSMLAVSSAFAGLASAAAISDLNAASLAASSGRVGWATRNAHRSSSACVFSPSSLMSADRRTGLDVHRIGLRVRRRRVAAALGGLDRLGIDVELEAHARRGLRHRRGDGAVGAGLAGSADLHAADLNRLVDAGKFSLDVGAVRFAGDAAPEADCGVDHRLTLRAGEGDRFRSVDALAALRRVDVGDQGREVRELHPPSAVVLLDDMILDGRRVERESGRLEWRGRRRKVERDPVAGVGRADRRRRLLAEIGREERLQLGGAVGARRQILGESGSAQRGESDAGGQRRAPGEFECDE